MILLNTWQLLLRLVPLLLLLATTSFQLWLSKKVSKKLAKSSDAHQNWSQKGTYARSWLKYAHSKCQDIIRTCLIQTGAKLS